MMKLKYEFHDAQSGIVFRQPDGINEVVDESAEKLFSLKANNGKGKSWLMTFLISSLVEYPDRAMKKPWLVMTEELLDKIKQLRSHSKGLIEGGVSLTLGELLVEVEYVLGKDEPIRKFALRSNPNDWSELDDNTLFQYARFCYLIPENPTKRIQGIRVNIKELIAEIALGKDEVDQSIQSGWLSMTENVKDLAVIQELSEKLERTEEKIEAKDSDLDVLEKLNIQVQVTEKLKELRSTREEINKTEKRQKR